MALPGGDAWARGGSEEPLLDQPARKSLQVESEITVFGDRLTGRPPQGRGAGFPQDSGAKGGL